MKNNVKKQYVWFGLIALVDGISIYETPGCMNLAHVPIRTIHYYYGYML